jgi:Lon protease-like protein
MTQAAWIPLFPLEVVLFPGALLPLHIFEPRYKAMIGRCLEVPAGCGVFLARDRSLAEVGCEARVAAVVRRYDDGRLDLLARGERRMALLELREHADGYLVGRENELADAPEEDDPDARLALWQLHQEYRRLLEDGDADPSAPASAPPEAAAETANAGYTFPLGAAMQIDLSERQKLLESRSERTREQMLIRHLARLLPQQRAANESRRRIRGNGKPVPAP